MRHALYVAPFDGLSDPVVAVELAMAAEEAGWDGVFLWDHMWRPSDKSPEVGDAWITLAAIASKTSTIRLGPMVVPLARRRPQKVARESVALDRLSGGRLTMGIGLGVDTDGELRRFDEVVDEHARGDVLDEALELLLELWTGDEVHHHGSSFTADGVRFLPLAIQQPRIPVWSAARGGTGIRPLRRASRLDGIFPVGTSDEQLSAMLATIGSLRGSLEGFDVAVIAPRGADVDRLERASVTWVLRSIDVGLSTVAAVHVASQSPRM
jgi:alkanesulfonate monooxygenase SsuD/methylene tetrahydromethanopterin reductase-like flavin-dependent oxidoreductase (luciferase family)